MFFAIIFGHFVKLVDGLGVKRFKTLERTYF